MMRYHNIRRKSSAAKEQKLKGFKLPPVVAKPMENMDECEETMKEAIQALYKTYSMGRLLLQVQPSRRF